MAQQFVNDGDSGLVARTKINESIGELYASLPIAIKITGMNANYSQAIGPNVMIIAININPVTGGPITLRIGTGPNGQDILPDTAIAAPQPMNVNQYFASAATLYFTFTSGSGTLNVRIDVINNFN